MTARYACPQCGKEYFGTGKLGQSSMCACGSRIPASLSDRAIRYWILRISALYGLATLVLGVALFHRHLPSNPWERLLSPSLLVPSMVIWAIVYQFASSQKRKDSSDTVLFRLYTMGMLFFIVSLLSAIVAGCGISGI